MPTLTQLEYIVAVDDHRHFGMAAKQKNVSQPSLSQQIQKAEDELEVIIFDRTAKPIHVTDAGEKVIQQARLILREHTKLLELTHEKDGQLKGHLKLGVIPTLSPYLIPLFLKDFAVRHPKVTLDVSEMQTAEIIRQLIDEKIDIGLLATPLHESRIHEDPLFYEPFFAYHSKNHPKFKKDLTNIKELKEEKAWVLSDGHCFGEQMLNYCSINRESPVFSGITFKSGSFETLQGLVDASESYTLFPKLFIDRLPSNVRRNQVKEFKAPAPSREVSLVFKRKVWKKDLLDALKKCIQDNLPEDLPKKPKKMKVLEIESI